MKINELVEQCIDSINHPERSVPENPLITLVGKRTLFPYGGGPRPKRLLCVNPNTGDKVWHYDAMSVLAALVAHGAIDVKFKDAEVEA